MSIRCYRHAGPMDLKSQEVVSPAPFGLRRSRTTVTRCLASVLLLREPFFFTHPLFRSFRTYMSIEKRMEAVFKVREDLNNERRA